MKTLVASRPGSSRFLLLPATRRGLPVRVETLSGPRTNITPFDQERQLKFVCPASPLQFDACEVPFTFSQHPPSIVDQLISAR
jgi:hypothetical protein